MAESPKAPSGNRPNQRASRRLPTKGSTKVRCYGNSMGLGANLAASILDLSETGIRLMLKAEVVPGQQMEVALEGPAGATLKLIAQVVWAMPTADGRFCVGAHFQKPIPYASLSSFSRL